MTPSIWPKRLTPQQFRTLALIACFFIGAIIVTGASVRVTGSGLGCPTWPECSTHNLIPRSSNSYHAFIEFSNRVFTGLLSLSVIVAVAASLLREPRSKTLMWLSFGLVIGVIAQIVLGGITVLVGLNPLAVAAHLVASCLLLSCAVVLTVLSRRRVTPSLKPLFQFNRQLVVVLLSLLVIVLGTVVTAAGPHAGDQSVERLGVSIESVARIHSLSAWLLLVVVGYLMLIKKDRTRSLFLFVGMIVIQGAWGYAQYFLNVPAWMVVFHVLFATTFFAIANVYWTTSIHKREIQSS